jgi:hypothetical protein
VLVQMYARERDHLVRTAKTAIDAGVRRTRGPPRRATRSSHRAGDPRHPHGARSGSRAVPDGEEVGEPQARRARAAR